MTWMLTCQAQVVHLDNPLRNFGALTIRTIAHSLACINRFTGHALRPYSVAEHSLLVADIIEREMHLGVHAQLAALMHDAHECVTGDQATPTKQVIGGDWHRFEGEHEHSMQTFFALREAVKTFGTAIKHADLVALATERRDLLPAGGPAWPALQGIEPLAHVDLRQRDGFAWQDWRAAFEDRYAELDFARNDLHRRTA